jgi:hypothetical protein
MTLKIILVLLFSVTNGFKTERNVSNFLRSVLRDEHEDHHSQINLDKSNINYLLQTVFNIIKPTIEISTHKTLQSVEHFLASCPCPIGQYCTSFTCLTCPAGYFCPGNDAQVPCAAGELLK